MSIPKRTLEPSETQPEHLLFQHSGLKSAPNEESCLVEFRPDAARSKSGTESTDDEEFEREYRAKLEKLRRSARALKEYSESLRSDKVADRQDYPRLRGKSMAGTLFDFTRQSLRQPRTLARHYAGFASELVRILRSESDLHPQRGDRRFRDAVWQDNPLYRMTLQTYLAWNRETEALLEDLEFDDDRDRARARFIFAQMSAALAPSNSPLNPVAVKRAYQTGGKSVLDGLRNMLEDLHSNHGMPRQIAPDAYELGKELGSSTGAVVYRSRLFELIQYGCRDEGLVRKRPVLIIPPQINKFYVFDLSPRNSVVQHLREQGLQVFIVSWKNPTRAEASAGLDNYIEELDGGVEAVLDISGSPDLNLVSACAGGITALSLQAWYKHRGRRPIRHHSVLVTALSVENHPTLDLFLNRETVASSLARSQRRGVMEGRELAHVFAWLRPTDLVWNYWVNNNLLGKEPPTMDVLFWDNDSTRLPAALHRDFVDVFLNHRLTENTLIVGGERLDLGQLEGDFYFLAGEDDYLMPWKNCFENSQLFPRANCRFVLSNSGHIQSVLRPPGIGSSVYYSDGDAADSAEDWLASAEKHKGSWWEDWSDWLDSRSGPRVRAPARLGNERHPPLCPSPGTYVMES